MKKIVLGLSGGVDSSVAAQLLRRDGYDVTGLYLDIGLPDGIGAAKRAAEAAGILLEVLDITALLEEKVCRPFTEAYLRGETPNPCIMCNPAVKFRALTQAADRIGAENIATGHYAAVERRDGRALLMKGKPSNDQSYMLCRVTREQLDRLVLPLGGFEKRQVRAMAEIMALPAAEKPDSMEICFIPDGDYAAFIEGRGRAPGPGNFVDETGNVLGVHRGIHHYTIGQRRGLGIAMGKRIFVSEIRPETNEVVLSDGDVLLAKKIKARDVNWLIMPGSEFDCTVRVRHSKVETRAAARVTDFGVEIEFSEPVRAPVPGQSAVMYDGDALIGGGYIF